MANVLLKLPLGGAAGAQRRLSAVSPTSKRQAAEQMEDEEIYRCLFGARKILILNKYLNVTI